MPKKQIFGYGPKNFPPNGQILMKQTLLYSRNTYKSDAFVRFLISLPPHPIWRGGGTGSPPPSGDIEVIDRFRRNIVY